MSEMSKRLADAKESYARALDERVAFERARGSGDGAESARRSAAMLRAEAKSLRSKK